MSIIFHSFWYTTYSIHYICWFLICIFLNVSWLLVVTLWFTAMYFKRLKIAVECVENLEAQDKDIYQTCAPIISHCSPNFSPNFEAILLVKWSMCNCDEKEKMNMLMTRVYHKYISKTFDIEQLKVSKFWIWAMNSLNNQQYKKRKKNKLPPKLIKF